MQDEDAERNSSEPVKLPLNLPAQLTSVAILAISVLQISTKMSERNLCL